MSCLVVRCRSCAPAAATELTARLERRLVRLAPDSPPPLARIARLDEELPDATTEDGWLIEVELPGEPPEEPFAMLRTALDEVLRELREDGGLALAGGVGLVAGSRVRLLGEFDLSALDVLQRSLSVTAASPVVVDLSQCAFLDAGVIAFLVGRAQAAGADPECFRLIGAAGQVERILALTGIAGSAWVSRRPGPEAVGVAPHPVPFSRPAAG